MAIPQHPRRLSWSDPGARHFHSLRVTFATLLVEGGASAKDCQALLRHHSPILTFDRYVKARPERLQAVAEVMWQTLRKPVAQPQQVSKQEQRPA